MNEPTTTASKRTKIAWAVIAFVTAAGLAIASFSSQWMTVAERHGSASFGLREVTACPDDDCTTQSISSVVHDINATGGHAGSAFPITGWVCSVALWLAALALAASAALMLAGRFVVRPIAPTTVALVALAAGLVSGVVFAALKPSPELGPGAACYVFAASELAGIITTIMIARIRPADPEWDDPQPFDEDKW